MRSSEFDEGGTKNKRDIPYSTFRCVPYFLMRFQVCVDQRFSSVLVSKVYIYIYVYTYIYIYICINIYLSQLKCACLYLSRSY